MPDPYGPTEFGGKTGSTGIQIPPHPPNAHEKLMLIYRTGDESGAFADDSGENWDGLIDYDQKLEEMETAGLMDKGQVWEEMKDQNQPDA